MELIVALVVVLVVLAGYYFYQNVMPTCPLNNADKGALGKTLGGVGYCGANGYALTPMDKYNHSCTDCGYGSALSCAQACDRNSQCNGFLYNPKTKYCYQKNFPSSSELQTMQTVDAGYIIGAKQATRAKPLTTAA
jgi:hypothetical protein